MVENLFHIPHQLLSWLAKYIHSLFLFSSFSSDLLRLSPQEVTFHLEKTTELGQCILKSSLISAQGASSGPHSPDTFRIELTFKGNRV